MSFEFSPVERHNKPPKKKGKLHANFNDQTNYREGERIEFLDNLFCSECGTPVFKNKKENPDHPEYGEQENSCGKCGRDFTKTLQKAKDLQAKLREKNAQNTKYTPPAIEI